MDGVVSQQPRPSRQFNRRASRRETARMTALMNATANRRETRFARGSETPSVASSIPPYLTASRLRSTSTSSAGYLSTDLHGEDEDLDAGGRIVFYNLETSNAGQCVSCLHNEEFPFIAEAIDDQGEEFFAGHGRSRVMNWLTRCFPSWMPLCPLEKKTEVSKRKHTAQDRDEIVAIDLTPQAQSVLPCLYHCWSDTMAAVEHNNLFVGTIEKVGCCTKVTDTLLCCHKPMNRPILQLRESQHTKTSHEILSVGIDDTLTDCNVFLSSFGQTAFVPGMVCDKGTQGDLDVKLAIPIRKIVKGQKHKEGEVAAEVIVSGSWDAKSCLCIDACHKLEDYELSIHFNDPTLSQEQRHLILAYAMYLDEKWVCPHREHNYGVRTCASRTACCLG
eukprot:m.27835 g.27835  ORF g.27835 m.27835 type:complete len:390 (-) comp8980_c0_seq1:418-1587(-)